MTAAAHRPRRARSPRRIPPPKSGSVETMTSLLTEGLVARGHDVTLFATGDSTTRRDAARRSTRTATGTTRTMWPWELYEMLNLAAAVERAARVRHHPLRGRLLPDVAGVHAAVADADRADAAPFAEPRRSRAVVALSRRRRSSPSRTSRRGCCTGSTSSARCCTASTPTRFTFSDTARRLPAVPRPVHRRARACCRRSRSPSAPGSAFCSPRAEDEYYREASRRSSTASGSSTSARSTSTQKVRLLGGARALLYPVQAREPFGLVLAEAMACGTPVAALDRGAVREVVDDGVTGVVFTTKPSMQPGLPRVFALDRRRVRERAVARFGADAHGRRVRRGLRAPDRNGSSRDVATSDPEVRA